MRIETVRGSALAVAACGALWLAGCEKTVTREVAVAPPESTYLVEYLPPMMGASEGRSTFQLRVRDRTTFAAASGLSLSVKATMDMGAMSHGTPVASVAESATPGTYDVLLYWLMADKMGATLAGYWTVDVAVPLPSGSETHSFNPSVSMAMGADTWKQQLYGPADAPAGASALAIDKYLLFSDGPVGPAAAPVLRLYLTRAGSMTTTFAPVAAATLGADLDPAFPAPVAAVHQGGGHWTIALPALPAGQSSVHVKLSVAGEDKTTNGQAPSGANAYATFKVTPQ